MDRSIHFYFFNAGDGDVTCNFFIVEDGKRNFAPSAQVKQADWPIYREELERGGWTYRNPNGRYV